MEQVLQILPSDISNCIKKYMDREQIDIQEIRLRVNQPIEINDGKHVFWLKNHFFQPQMLRYFLTR
ncbi:hypothetical protein JCM21714_178 [Gracilibacillus boraciitolerans JCM 21714]|uniref:Uncharacterized protein n=1 Tax=Gracilibacillus boraciitolerans JCM 21714 TaxID=1298598 RepID=W4VEQ0_9BACI|nr:hypothetical protein [Gracilibacillus boraciitolerans]GAE91234.1 hypothetical protein JCM21714_178 [Gracilibacillus boraciitolerans JCM 21714]